MKLTKEESRRRWAEIRALWGQWDPIGVAPFDGGPQDEYDAYLGPSLRLLEESAPASEIAEYLAYIVGDYMGLGEQGVSYAKPLEFAEKLKDWYAESWADRSI